MKYTRESPFEFKGVKYYLHAYGEALVVNECSRESITDLRATDASAIHALVKAEKSPWQPVAFADVKVDDEIKSVSDCGTMRRGVVSGRHVTFAEDADRNYIAKDTWTLYRRTPPLPAVPKVGDYIRAVLRSGNVHEFEVTKVECGFGSWHVRGSKEAMHVDAGLPSCKSPNLITSWSPTTRPTPAWHTPEPWSLWDITYDGKERRYVAIKRNGYIEFIPVAGYGSAVATDPRITAGREVTR